jgi:hypothetical protein
LAWELTILVKHYGNPEHLLSIFQTMIISSIANTTVARRGGGGPRNLKILMQDPRLAASWIDSASWAVVKVG